MSNKCVSCGNYTYEGENLKGYCSYYGGYYYPNDSCSHWDDCSDGSVKYKCASCGNYTYEGKYSKGYCSYYGGYYDSNDSCNHWEEGNNVSSSGGCFLTTACCEYKGLPDDCYELTTLRYLRDSYMKKSLVGSKLVDLYYDIAPDIVEKINLLDNKKEIYQEIYQEIQKIVILIEDTKYSDAVEKYIDIMLELDRKVNNI